MLALGRGGFWRARVDDHAREPESDASATSVAAVVPARNEAETIGASIVSLATQRFAGSLSVTLVDDASDDGTAGIARAAYAALPEPAALHIEGGRALEAPWTGKLNALDAGVHTVRARQGDPTFWLFTDADIVHHPDNVAELVAKAQRDGLDLVSLMVQLRCESPWERLLVPAFIFFFAKLYPFAWSNDPARSTAAAAGGCVLLRASALERIGGLRAIAGNLIDDCALAAAVKATGGTTFIGLTARTVSVRAYRTLDPFWTMVKRTAFTQLGRSYVATIGATLVMGLLYVAPPALTIAGAFRRDALLAASAGAAWAIMAALYVPTLRAYGRPRHEALLLPIAATLYMTMTLDSARAHALGKGGAWKGRFAT